MTNNFNKMQPVHGEKNPITITEARKIKHAISCQHLLSCDLMYCYLECPKFRS